MNPNITGEVSVHDLHFKLGPDFGHGFTKLLFCPQHDISVNNQVYLWVTSKDGTGRGLAGRSRYQSNL